jgi:hypothetical protein
MISGKKTYIMAGLSVLYAIAGVLLGHIDYNTAVQIVIDSGLVAALRSGIAKV